MSHYRTKTFNFSHDIDEIENLTDDLGRRQIARAIADELRRTDERAKVIGVYGWWGSGKSHLLSQTIKQLQEDNDNGRAKMQVITCTFKSWQYEMAGDLAPGLIRSLINVDQQFNNQSLLTNPDTYQKIGYGLLGLLPLVTLKSDPTGQLGGFLSQLVSTSMANMEEYKKSLATTAPHSYVDQIRDQMEELVQGILNAAAEKDSTKQYRLVVFIDDLDRCSPENMVRMFEWLKVHLSVKGCTYVMALDHIAAARAIVGRYKEYLGEERDLEYGLRYLEKLVDSEYELGLPTSLQRMAIRRVYDVKHERLSRAIGAYDLYDLGNFPCATYMDDLLELRALRIPRTMLKIVRKYKSCLDILTKDPQAKRLARELGTAYPFWALLLVAMYYRLEPSDVDDFIQGRGNIYGLLGSYKSIKEEQWSQNPASPKHQFCQFAYDAKKDAGPKLMLPDTKFLRQLAAIIRENAFTGAEATSM